MAVAGSDRSRTVDGACWRRTSSPRGWNARGCSSRGPCVTRGLRERDLGIRGLKPQFRTGSSHLVAKQLFERVDEQHHDLGENQMY